MTWCLPRLMAVHTGGRDTGGTCRQREGRGSWLRSERGGQRFGGMPDKNRTWSACPRRGRCQPPLGRGLPQHSGRGGRSSGRRRRKRHKAPATEQSTTMRLAVTLASNAALPKPGATTPCVPAAPARSTSGAAAGRRGMEPHSPQSQKPSESSLIGNNGLSRMEIRPLADPQKRAAEAAPRVTTEVTTVPETASNCLLGTPGSR